MKTVQTNRAQGLQLFEAAAVQSKLEQLIPDKRKRERFVAIAATTAIVAPELAECDPRSVINCLLQVAAYGLTPGNTRGEAYLLKFNSKKGPQCTLIVGYRGMEKMATRTGIIRCFWSAPICKGDEFEFRGPFKEPHYREDLQREKAPTWDEISSAFAVAYRPDGMVARALVVPKWGLKRAKDASLSRTGGAWKTHPDMMAKKTAVRRLCAELQSMIEFSSDFEDLVSRETAAEGSEVPANAREAEFEEMVSKVADRVIDRAVEAPTSALAAALTEKAAESAPEAAEEPEEAEEPQEAEDEPWPASDAQKPQEEAKALPDRMSLLRAAGTALSTLEASWFDDWRVGQLDVADDSRLETLNDEQLQRFIEDAEAAAG